MITFRDVSKIYHIGGEEVRALDHASMQIEQGEFVGIIGPSGSGKSTLMNIMGCLDVADEGEYILDGQPIEHYSERELAKIRNHKIGFIFQNFNLIQKMSAEENVELPLIYQGVPAPERKRRVKEALDRVALGKRRTHRPTELSGGQQQRVAIARAIVTRPSLFLADEPTGNLDSKTSMDVILLMQSISRQFHQTTIMITHNEEIAQMADRTIRIEDGKVVSGGVRYAR